MDETPVARSAPWPVGLSLGSPHNGEIDAADRDLRPLALFHETHRPRLSVVVCNEPEERLVAGVRILPWRLFFDELWNDRIISG